MSSTIRAQSKVMFERAVDIVFCLNLGLVAASCAVDGHEALFETLCLPSTNVSLTWL